MIVGIYARCEIALLSLHMRYLWIILHNSNFDLLSSFRSHSQRAPELLNLITQSLVFIPNPTQDFLNLLKCLFSSLVLLRVPLPVLLGIG